MRASHIDRGLAYFWERRERRLRRVRINEPRQHLRRHTRKYAEGELDEDRSFYFRGPEGRQRVKEAIRRGDLRFCCARSPFCLGNDGRR